MGKPTRNKVKDEHPEILKEWDFVKNSRLDPETITTGSSRMVWWICSTCGHSYQATIFNRCNKDYIACVYCRRQIPIQGKNDLKTLRPEIAKEWHFEKNGSLKPEDFTIKSPITVWWKCKNEHEFQAPIYKRARGISCPICRTCKAEKGKTDLQTTDPELSSEWHPTKNEPCTPADVTNGSHKKIWWICSRCGKEFKARINYRSAGQKCPYCSKL